MTTEPFADQHAIIEAAQNRICKAEELIYAALADIPKPRGAITTGCDEWRFCELAGAYTRYLTMGHWELTGDSCAGIHVTVDLNAEQTETGALRDWNIGLDGQDGMTAEGARRLAAALLDAAAALEAGRQQHSDRDDRHRDDLDRDDDHPDDPDDPERDDPDGGALEASQSRRSDTRA